jgi:hypothetical protein
VQQPGRGTVKGRAIHHQSTNFGAHRSSVRRTVLDMPQVCCYTWVDSCATGHMGVKDSRTGSRQSSAVMSISAA